VGKREAAHARLCGVLAGGHVLLEDLPGLGKRSRRSFAQAARVAFHPRSVKPDLLPADLTGPSFSISGCTSSCSRRGPLFTGLLLPTRSTVRRPKTQAASPGSDAESQITVEGETFV